MSNEELIAEQKKALDYWYEGFNTGDIELAYTRFDPDCTWSGVGKNLERVTYAGRDTIIAYQSAWVKKVWTGKMTYFPKNCVCDGNTLMAEWDDEAVSSVTGETYKNTGVFVFEFDGTTTVKRGRAWFDAGPLQGTHVERFAEEGVGTGS
ncbi:MAG: nuclear transport factor 2 family protein [Solirubrobacterales bacterium]